jgi:serine/threonine protein kinase
MKKTEEWDEEMAIKEVDVLKELNHEHLIKYFEHFDEFIFGADYFCIVCELCEVVYFISLGSSFLYVYSLCFKRMEI